MPEEESFHCWHLFKGGASSVVAKLADFAAKKGVDIRTDTPAKKLILDNGKVVGVEAVNTETGETVIVRAKKVLLATGGFAANRGMIEKYVPDSSDPSVSEPIWLRSALTDGRTGDGINMAMKVGGAPAGMEHVVGNAPYLPDRPPINQFNGPDWLKQGRCALAQPWLWIDRNGERFFNESRGSVFTEVYAAMTNAGGIMYNILDQAKFDQLVKTGPLIPFNAIVTVGTPLKELPKTFEEGRKRGWAYELPRAHARSFVGACSYFQQRSDTLSLMQVSDHYGRVHYAPIEFEQLLQPLIPEFLAADVDRAVDIRIEPSSVSCFIQTSFDSLSRKYRLCRHCAVIRNGIKIKAACTRCIAFLALNDLYTVLLCLVLEHADKNGMGKHHEILIVLASHADFLFPVLVHPDDQRSQIMGQTVVDHHAACFVQQVLNLAVSLESFDANVSVLFFGSKLGRLLVVALIQAFQNSALDQNGSYPGFGRYESCKVIDP